MSKNIIFQGKIIYLKPSWYANIIFPIVQLKKLFQTIYDFLLQLIWQELITGKKSDNEIANLIAFIVFCLLSIGLYHIKAYSQIILISSVIIWYLDCFISRAQYHNNNNQINVTVHSLDTDEILWTLNLPNKQIKSKLLLDQVKNISISKKTVFGGAFQAVLGQVLQVEINLFDGNNFVIDENKNINQSFDSAQKIANKLDLSVVFSDSQGNNNYATEQLNENHLKSITLGERVSIKCHKSQGKWHLYTQWHFGDSWQLIKQVFHQAGFFVFLIIMSKLMIELGQLLDNIIQSFQGKTDIIYFPSPLEWLTPNWNWKNTVELLFIIAVLVYQAWPISRVKHIYLDQYYVKFAIDNKTISKLNIQDIKLILFLSKPKPEMIILSSDKAIIINQFNPEIGQFLLAYLDQGLHLFQQK